MRTKPHTSAIKQGYWSIHCISCHAEMRDGFMFAEDSCCKEYHDHKTGADLWICPHGVKYDKIKVCSTCLRKAIEAAHRVLVHDTANNRSAAQSAAQSAAESAQSAAQKRTINKIDK